MIKVNLLGGRATRVSGSGVQQLAVFLGIIGVTVAGLFVLHQSVEAGVTELTKSEKKLKDDEAKMLKVKQKVEQLKTQTEQIEKRSKLIQDLNKVRTGPVRLLRELSGIIPKDVWIDGFSENGKNVSFDCTAMSPDLMIEFKRNLEKSPFFYEVRDLGTTTIKGATAGTDFQRFKISAKVVYAPKSVIAQELPPPPSMVPVAAPSPVEKGAALAPPEAAKAPTAGPERKGEPGTPGAREEARR